MNCLGVPLNETLSLAVAETLEALAFMEVLPGEDAEADDSGHCASENALWAGIDILEPCSMRIVICVPEMLAREIVAELFALDSPDSVEHEMINDTMAEIINTIAGRVMTSMLGDEQTLVLGLPETGRGGAEEEWDETLSFTAGDYQFMVRMRGSLN